MKIEKLNNNLFELITFTEYYAGYDYITKEDALYAFCEIVGMEKIQLVLEKIENEKILKILSKIFVLEFAAKAYWTIFLGGIYSRKNISIELDMILLEDRLKEVNERNKNL